MRSGRYVRRVLLSLLVDLACAATPGVVSANPAATGPIDERQSAKPETVGRDLFLHKRRPHDRLSRGGDGLGPMFNERSCVACHNQGGAGGGGGHNNVQILSIVETSRTSKPAAQDWEQAATVHAGLLEHPSGVVLHRFSNDAGYFAWRQQRLWAATAVGSPYVFSATVFRPQDQDPVAAVAIQRALLRGRLHAEGKALLLDLQAIVDRAHGTDAGRSGLLKLLITERNATSLFGAGLLDSISDDVLENEAFRQQQRAAALPLQLAPAQFGAPGAPAAADMPVVGRVARLADGRIGRFGWKGQNATLSDFTRNACAVELGLEVPDHHQALDPRVAGPDHATTHADLDETDCEALVAYLAALPAPEQTVNKRHANDVAAGSAFFERIGCADCHARNLGELRGVYSDLLLHDMGGTLTGPAYYGTVTGTMADDPAAATDDDARPPSGSEWRTPPLWGCRDSAPYLHDGRADMLAQAIAAHDGQGAAATRNFSRLAPLQQRQMIEFLNSLTAPKAAKRAASTPPRALKRA